MKKDLNVFNASKFRQKVDKDEIVTQWLYNIRKWAFYEINENKAKIFVNVSESNSQVKALEQKFENNKMGYYSFFAGTYVHLQ